MPAVKKDSKAPAKWKLERHPDNSNKAGLGLAISRTERVNLHQTRNNAIVSSCKRIFAKAVRSLFEQYTQDKRIWKFVHMNTSTDTRLWRTYCGAIPNNNADPRTFITPSKKVNFFRVLTNLLECTGYRLDRRRSLRVSPYCALWLSPRVVRPDWNADELSW